MQRDGTKNLYPLPHPIEWIVGAMMMPTHYEKVAQFKYANHALEFVKTMKCFKTIIVPPAVHGVAR